MNCDNDEVVNKILLAGYAHDINNILTAISAKAFLAQDENPDKLRDFKEKLNQELKDIQDLVDTASQMLRSFMSFIKDKNSPQLINLKKYTELMFANIKLNVKSIDSNINFDYNPLNEKAYIEGNPEKIYQIISNLAINAAQATEKNENKIVTISAMLTELENNSENSQKAICITVKDNGIGMNKKELKDCTKAFYTTKNNGNGLGLAIVSRNVELMNGKLTIESKKGSGTEFNVYLPIKDEMKIITGKQY